MSINAEQVRPLFDAAVKSGATYIAFIEEKGKPLQSKLVMPGENPVDAVYDYMSNDNTNIKVCSTTKSLVSQLNTPVNFHL